VRRPEEAEEMAQSIATTGVHVVCLPQTNLFLQGREHATAQPRGLTPVRTLLAAGANVAAGGDNVQDPFNCVGRGDPLETASLLVAAAHLTPDQAYHAVSGAARLAMGLSAVRVAPRAPAELLAIRAASVREAIATASGDRLVIHRGHPMVRTAVTREFLPGATP
jgi:cytosine deaminase